VPSWIETFASRAAKMRPLLARELVERYGPTEGTYAFLDDIDVGPAHRPVRRNQSLYLWSKTALAGYILTMPRRIAWKWPTPSRDGCRSWTTAGGAHPVPAGAHEDPRDDGEVRPQGGGARRHHRHRLPAQKHPFLSPPSTLTPDESFHTFVQDTLRGPQLAAMPFFDQRQVVDLLDVFLRWTPARGSPTTRSDAAVSMCVLNEGFRLTRERNASRGR